MKIGQILIFIISILIAFSYYFIIKNYPELMPSYIQNLQKYFFSNPETTKQPEYDIIIVGAGLAGLTSAYEANLISNGKLKILLLEQEKKYGGNSIKASSGINILNSPIQEKEKIKDSYNLFYNDTIRSGKGRSIPQLVSILVNDSHDIFNYYTKLGIDLSHVGLLGGHSAARTHRPEKIAVGYHLDSSMFNVIKDIKSIKYQVNSTVIELIYNKDKNEVNGVVYYDSFNKKNVKIYSKCVILTCGGFGHDFESDSLLKEFVPHLMNFPTTNGPQSKGIGMKIARKIGVQLVDMDQVQVHPTAFVNLKKRYEKNKILAAELLRGVGGILINQKGMRFSNELGTRDYVTKRILDNCEKNSNSPIDQYEAFIIINQKCVDIYGPNVYYYINLELLKKYNNFKEFANTFNLPYDKLSETIINYNKNENGKEDEFGKKVFPMKFDLNEVIYAGIITPSIHYTMGGIKMNNDTEIYNTNGKIIKGLFGAGEVTGGVHGGNRLGGNSLLECAVYGRKSAQSAYNLIKKLN